MATPLGHALAGYAVSSFSVAARDQDRPKLVLICIAMAVAPDLDLVPGLFQGKPVLYHGSITHSLGFAVVLSLVVAWIFKFSVRSFITLYMMCFVAYGSHLILDFLGPDGRQPYGIPLFWPLSGEHFLSPVPFLLGVRHVGSTSTSTLKFVESVASLYNLAAVLLEFIILVPFALAGKRYRHIKSRHST